MECYILRELWNDRAVKGLYRFACGESEGYFDALEVLLPFACEGTYTENTIAEYIVRLLLGSRETAKCFSAPATALPYLSKDLERLAEEVILVDWSALTAGEGLLPFPVGEKKRDAFAAYGLWVERLVAATGDSAAFREGLEAFYGSFSGSSEARYAAFRWKGGALEGVSRPDPQSFADLGGLEYQKKTLMDNTRAFLEGKPANNVLLVGGSGTGKSSCVKACLNRFAGEGLRLVEVGKQELASLPRLLNILGERKCRYVLFIDDLSFESPDASYMELKVALDGQIEQRPAHVLIYATSNRRRLVRETWKDRDSGEDVHENDTLHEKLSLSERFGIRLFFPVLTQPEYFDIVRLLLAGRGIAWSDETGKLAAAWATQYNGRSGRTAKQFVADYAARLHTKETGDE